MRKAQAIVPLILLTAILCGQAPADSSGTAFRKGRNLVQIQGSVASSYINTANTAASNNQTGNLYNISFNLGKMVGDRHMLGATFRTSRTHLVGVINSRAESMGTGPVYRYYSGTRPDVSLFFQTSLSYSSYYGTSEGNPSLFSVSEILDVHGIRASLGLGVAYVLADRISFEVGSEYSQGRYWGVYEDLVLRNQQEVILDRGELVFTFGFTILFEKLRGNE